MTRRLLTLAVLLACTVPLNAQNWTYKKTLADITVSGTAAALFTASDVQQGNGHPAASQATCQLVTANIRVTIDGTTPTTSLGTVLTPGVWFFTGPDTLLNAQAIRDDSTSGVLSCTIYGQ